MLGKTRLLSKTGGRLRALALAALAVLTPLVPARADEVPTLTLALQEGGTAAWELAAIRDLGLEAAHGVRIDLRPVADSRAGQIALQAGAVDAILSDFIWVSARRHEGADLTFVPHSLAVGALMAPPGGRVARLEDLAGARLGVAGGPLDKSFLLLQARYAAVTGRALTDDLAGLEFGAPPLINELLAGGQIDASLNFWHFNARAAAAGAAVEVLSLRRILADLGIDPQPPLLGWTFSETRANAAPEAFQRFLAASFAAKAALLTDDALWRRIRPAMNLPEGAPDTLFLALRDAYRAGIVAAPDPAHQTQAEATFAVLAQVGGAELTGGAQGLAPGTFWAGLEW